MCGWCAAPVLVRVTGRTPKWCSATCRHRAWETARAHASRDVPVRVVDRIVEVEVRVEVPVQVEVQVSGLPKGNGWVAALKTLTDQIDGAARPPIYPRDLDAIEAALVQAARAVFRQKTRRR